MTLNDVDGLSRRQHDLLAELIFGPFWPVRPDDLAKALQRKPKNGANADLADFDVGQIKPQVMSAVVSCLACTPDNFLSADHRRLSAAKKLGDGAMRTSWRGSPPTRA